MGKYPPDIRRHAKNGQFSARPFFELEHFAEFGEHLPQKQVSASPHQNLTHQIRIGSLSRGKQLIESDGATEFGDEREKPGILVGSDEDFANCADEPNGREKAIAFRVSRFRQAQAKRLSV